jgi:hypothetical protein
LKYYRLDSRIEVAALIIGEAADPEQEASMTPVLVEFFAS